jgi:hypothetical protein
MTDSETFHVRKTVRPMRFLFLVPRNDLNAVKQVIRINTALWGGFYNPITTIDQSNENILSLFKASHSDVIVNFSTQPILNSSLGLENYQVIQMEGFDGLLQNENGKYQFRYGCDMHPLMKFYWKEEGRFQIISQTETKESEYFYFDGDDDHWVNYSLLEFGQYPLDHVYDYKSGYQKATNCATLQINASNILEVRHKNLLTPLIFTLAETKYLYYGAYSRFFNETIIYIGDIDNEGDWVEFWNLRCFYSRVTFIHWEDLSLFENHIRNISEKRKSRESNNKIPKLMVQKSSSISSEIFSATTKKVAQIISDEIVVSYDLHPIGISYEIKKNRPHGTLPIEAPIAKSYEEEDIEYLSENKIELKVPIPEFLIPYASDRRRSWCTTINGWRTRENDFWLKIPNMGKVEENLRKNLFFFEGFRISPRENIVLFPRCYSARPLDIETIYLPSHLNILKSIFEGYKIEVSDYSEKGRYAMAIEEAAAQGKWFGANILLDRGVQAILYRLSKTNGEMHLPRQELEKIAGEKSLSVQDKKISSSQLINILIERKILQIGLELKCNKCYSQGWYHISQFGESFKCLYCYSEQDLPIIDNKEWRYKSAGLFSSPGVGHGSLPVICLNLYLQRRYHNNLRPFYSFNVKFPDGKSGEVDLAFVRHETRDEPELLVCECKSGEAHQEDFDRLEKLCSLMPGTVACLATWKDSFSKDEKMFARNIWDKGFEIIMLTHLDIESNEIIFEGVDDQHKYIHNFVDLAHATYQKYMQ